MSDPQTDHVEDGVQRMADLHAAHNGELNLLEHGVGVLTASLAQPLVLLAAAVLVGGWIGFGLLAALLHLKAFDPPPYPLLECAATIAALFMTLLILATQRREEIISRRRSQLTLQLAVMSEQKIAKVIGMLEEQRQENPMLPSRSDREAEDLSTPADPGHVLDRIIQTHEGSPRKD